MSKQLGFFDANRWASRRIVAPFSVEASEATGPGYHSTFWRLLSYRKPLLRWNPNPWHFDGVIRDEIRYLDIHLVADIQGHLHPASAGEQR